MKPGGKALYQYNDTHKPPLADAVRDVLRRAGRPLTADEVVSAVERLGIASYDTRQAVGTALRRMVEAGEASRSPKE